MTLSTPLRSPSPSTQRRSTKGFQPLEWEETAYTKIPRGWSRFCRELAGFLRFIGLGILVTSFQGTFRKDFSEPKKVTVIRSRISSLLRALIHIPPISIALLEIIVNLRGHYVGGDFDRQSYYQIAAKAHEIAIDASLASIVLSYIRYELAIGDGLPFGAFLGSLQFSTVSYLWSRELWSSLFAPGNKLHRIRFCILVIICGILAATAGPSSATLLIPRQTRWSVKPTYVLINGSNQDVWPDYVDSRRTPLGCSIVSPTSTNGDSLCPGSVWESIFGILVGSIASDLLGVFSDSQDIPDYTYNIQGPGDEFIWVNVDDCGPKSSESSSSQACAVSEPLIVANAAFNDSLYWTGLDGYTSFIDIFHSVTKDLYAPYTAVRCLHDTIHGPGDTAAIQFPSLSKSKEDYARPAEAIALDDLTKAHTYAYFEDTSAYNLMWTDLPEEQFGTAVSGVILSEPQDPTPSSPRNISTCTFAAGWGTSTMEEDYGQSEITISASDIPTSILQFLGSDVIGSGLGFRLFSFFGPVFANSSGQAYPQRPVRMSVEWLNYLNPISKLPDGTNNTIINAYMSVFPERLPERVLAQLVAYMLEGGLSVIGLDLAWQALPNGPTPCNDCQIFEVNHEYAGWAYTSSSTSVRLAIALMITYCTLALCHIFYLGIFGLSSDSWDTAAEVIALAMNSSPTRHLQNTCSGIYGMRPFRTIVRIVATTQEVGGQEDHLELVFGDKAEANQPLVKMEIGKEYGSFP